MDEIRHHPCPQCGHNLYVRRTYEKEVRIRGTDLVCLHDHRPGVISELMKEGEKAHLFKNGKGRYYFFNRDPPVQIAKSS